MSNCEFMEPTIDHEAERRWRLSRRNDLATVVGIVLTVPSQGEDEFGTWRYGARPLGGMAHSDIVDEFNADMREIIGKSAQPLQDVGVLSTEQVAKLDSHRYETGPAAQSWPQVFFEIYKHVQPVLTDAATLIAVAQFLKDAYRGIEDWKNRKFDETRELAADINFVQPHAENRSSTCLHVARTSRTRLRTCRRELRSPRRCRDRRLSEESVRKLRLARSPNRRRVLCNSSHQRRYGVPLFTQWTVRSLRALPDSRYPIPTSAIP